MRLLLTDRLSCPRCGPAFGLILRADRLADRRVHDGVLGCPNCRDTFAVDAGFADLRAPPRGDLPEGRAGSFTEPEADEVERTVALLGIHRGPGTAVAIGAAARFAGLIVEAVEDLEVAAVDPDTRAWPEQQGVSRLVSGPGLPFFDRSLRGAVVGGGVGRGLLWEAARVTAPKGRVVVFGAGEDAVETLREAGLNILAHEAETVVAARG